MARTLGQLAGRMRELAASIPVRANDLKKQVASTVNFDLLQTTPVDTGKAVSNWIVNLDEASTEVRDAFVPTREGYSKQTNGERAWTHRSDPEATRQVNVQPALALASEAIDAAQPGQEIHITNNLPYIDALNNGHSQQASLFVERAIILGENLVSRATLTD